MTTPSTGARSSNHSDQVGCLTSETICETLRASLSSHVRGERVLVLIPDGTRSIPLAALFPLVIESLCDAQKIDFMIALGTHPPLRESDILGLLGLTANQRRTAYGAIGIHNNAWSDDAELIQIGTLTRDHIGDLATPYWHPSLGGDVPVRLNRAALEADRVVILGPVFPHEVAGFSGGAKYLFPGISGPEMIDVSHWLGALVGIPQTIGVETTPVRSMIEAAADLVPTPITAICPVVVGGNVTAFFAGDRREAWTKAVRVARESHIIWVDQPFDRVISCAPPMYDELWTAAKAVYRLEPALADGAEIILYAPHLDTVSRTHGRYIREVGYHVLPYFLEQWDRFADYPLAVLAHSTHLKGAGTFHDGVERSRVSVKLASRISPAECRELNLGYVDPRSLDPETPPKNWAVIANAGEDLYRVRD